jgi:hypothetical protein
VGLAVAVGRIGNVVAAYAASAAIDRGGPGVFMLWSVLMLFVLAALAGIRDTSRAREPLSSRSAHNVALTTSSLSNGSIGIGTRSIRRPSRRRVASQS